MRCYWKRAVTSGSLLFLCLFVYLCLRDEEPKILEKDRRLARELAMQQLYSERNGQSFRELLNLSSTINITYQYLAGFPVLRKKFLAVGLSSVRRKRGNYLQETLKSIFTQSTNEELLDMVVVVHLADFDLGWNTQVVLKITQKFAHHIISGRLIIIHAPEQYYPPLKGLKRNYNDEDDRVTFRSKQNVDYAFLMNLCANLSDYYLMLEDDVQCSHSFLSAIRKVLASKEGSYWVTLEFSKLGYIGKLYHGSDLPRLAHFLLMFYQEMPCDWLLNHFRGLLTQKDVIRFKPSLFQHIGYYSSFRGTENRLKDDDFEEDFFDIPDNPPAHIYTNLKVFENYNPTNAYSNSEEYFWGKSPSAGDYFTIVFTKTVNISRIQVVTGLVERQNDVLNAGILEIGKHQTVTLSGQDCSHYVQLGEFQKGRYDQKGLDTAAGNEVQCVRIRITKSQNDWLIIRTINIWSKHS
ncbi:alpha-1,3-mannosyl-glycoprotein 4-beta-N-acetylglucosaminyltransferase C [Callorhinchus milii]|uniref:alpha-1,3-mannosyl-glycoprotein 4-beta-N-acetylglucosaminyltransferase C n=1 Tax=Callorhinchus milii TaxID=7868 RepID=UPI001C3FF607|nr:alpha-1,3-mannosyl-glycoprotein 4-beta-N-acetylglucosaminyltransferase C [Callorhinchus milii]XP_007892345.2 alpha-1,3-mannosyl-glycoprotein 4-beta-N-acetylglucosaminyltransferase C [Callorhinchus milii]